MNPVQTFKKDDLILKIYQDEDPMTPREWDNFGVFATWHRDYILGDEQPKCSPKEYIEDLPEGTIILNVYMMDHSGISLSTSSFGCPWDSGQVGIIYATPEVIAQEGWKIDDPEDVRKVKNLLNAEIKTYSQCLEGDVYGFVMGQDKVCETCGNVEFEEIDSCWGFYGSDFDENGLFDHAGIEDIDEWEEV